MATWPGSLPTDFLEQGFSETAPDNVIKSDMDVGPPKTRRRTSAAVRPIKGVIKMTTAQVATHDTFFTDTTFDGAEAFDWTDPRTGASVSFLYTPGAPPSYQPDGGDYWLVTINLLTMP